MEFGVPTGQREKSRDKSPTLRYKADSPICRYVLDVLSNPCRVVDRVVASLSFSQTHLQKRSALLRINDDFR